MRTRKIKEIDFVFALKTLAEREVGKEVELIFSKKFEFKSLVKDGNYYIIMPMFLWDFVKTDLYKKYKAVIESSFRHEVAHLKYSNFEKIKEAAIDFETPSGIIKYIDPRIKDCINVFEDIFVDDKESKKSRVYKLYLEEAMEFYFENFKSTIKEVDIHNFDRVNMAIIFLHNRIAEERVAELFGEEIVDYVKFLKEKEIILEKGEITSSEISFEKGSDLVKESLKKYFMCKRLDLESSSKEPSFVLPGGSSSLENTEELKKEIFESIGEKIKEYTLTNTRHIPHPSILEHDIYEDYSLSKTLVADTSTTSYLEKEAENATLVLKNKFTQVLLAKNKSKIVKNRKDGNLDFDELAFFKTGDENIFERKKTKFKLNTSVCILCDLSGSMASRMPLLRVSVMALSKALQSLNIEHEVLGFSGPYPSIILNPEPPFNRFKPIKFHIIKDYNTHYRSAKGLYPLITNDCCNCDPEALVWSIQRIALRRTKRKIVLVLTDGVPECHTCNPNILLAELKRIIDMTTKYTDIEIYGIGIESSHVSKIYPKHIIVESIDELPTKLYSLLLERVEEIFTEEMRMGA